MRRVLNSCVGTLLFVGMVVTNNRRGCGFSIISSFGESTVV